MTPTASRRGRGRRGPPWPPAAPEGWLYTLSLVLPRRRRIRVGALGTFVFPAGRYLYTGSARRGAAARIARHARRDKRLRWHIDYFRRFALLDGIRILPAAEATECELNRQALERPGARVPVRGFGSSDCPCPAHLVFVAPPGAGRPRNRAGDVSSDRIETPSVRGPTAPHCEFPQAAEACLDEGSSS